MLGQIAAAIFLVGLAFCALTVIYLFILAVAGLLASPERIGVAPARAVALPRIAILVPAYKEDFIIRSTAKNLLELDYPKSLYDVFIIADSFQESTLVELRQLPIQVLPVQFERSTKARSLNAAFQQITQPYEIALICDADNLLRKDFLTQVAYAFQSGVKAVQGQRVAKNLDSSFAILDACSEGINNHIFRKGTYALGLSSSVIGSGMGFEYDNLKKQMSEIEATGGFDKILQMKIVGQGNRIHYLEEALIYDEKVETPEAFQQQRKRWVSSQFQYLRKYFMPSISQLLKGNLNYFNLGVMHNLILPRSFLFLLLPLLLGVSALWFHPWLGWSAALLGLFAVTLVISVPKYLWNLNLAKALGSLPRAVFLMAGTIFHIRKANKTFIHTKHTKTEVNHKLFNLEDKP